MTKLLILLSTILASCQAPQQFPDSSTSQVTEETFKSIGDIPAAGGFKRVRDSLNGFGAWLRAIPLRADRKVYLYNGRLKENQSAQFAVMDISVGKKDLQQCADAVMRLRAEYLLTVNPSSIAFLATNGQVLSFDRWRLGFRYRLIGNRLQEFQSNPGLTSLHQDFTGFMELVFSFCGTASLQQQLRIVKDIHDISPGDVYVKAGFPGHAVIVVDVAVNAQGRKEFLLAQSYMPAQDIHVLRNPKRPIDNPWYDMESVDEVVTPEWVFRKEDLYRW